MWNRHCLSVPSTSNRDVVAKIECQWIAIVMQYVLFMGFLCMLLNMNYTWKQLVVFTVHHYTWLSLGKDVRFISCFSEELKHSGSVNYFESFFFILKARVVAPVSYGQLYVGHQNMCTACFIFLFFCLPVLFCYRHVKGVYWVRCLVGGYLYVCCEFSVMHACQMICRDVSVGSGVGKGTKD